MVLNQPRNSCSWKVTLTDTFRNKSSKLPDGSGRNLQNPSKHVCTIYEPDEGKVFIQTDQSGAEALVVAYLCGDGSFKDLFLNGIKSHVYVALHVFAEVWRKKVATANVDGLLRCRIPNLRSHPDFKGVENLIKESDNWPAAERYYFIAKMICHAANYGMKGPTFAGNVLEKSQGKVALSVDECNKFLGLYHSLFPEIMQWHVRVERQVRHSKVLANLFGHPREFRKMDDNSMKEAYAFVPQSTVGVITNNALVEMQCYIEEHKKPWDILNNKHDSYLLQCPLEDVTECAQLSTQFMGQELTAPDGSKFRMKSEALAGYNWAPAGPKNPRGLGSVKIG